MAALARADVEDAVNPLCHVAHRQTDPEVCLDAVGAGAVFLVLVLDQVVIEAHVDQVRLALRTKRALLIGQETRALHHLIHPVHLALTLDVEEGVEPVQHVLGPGDLVEVGVVTLAEPLAGLLFHGLERHVEHVALVLRGHPEGEQGDFHVVEVEPDLEGLVVLDHDAGVVLLLPVEEVAGLHQTTDLLHVADVLIGIPEMATGVLTVGVLHWKLLALCFRAQCLMK